MSSPTLIRRKSPLTGLLPVLALFTLTIAACSGVKPAVSTVPPVSPATSLTAERPKDEAFRTEQKKELSTLNILIEATTDDLARALNQSVRKELYKGSTGTSGVTATILRNGAISVSAADNFLYFNLPVTMKLGYSMFETAPLALQLKFKVSASVTADWKLNTEIYYLGLSEQLVEKIGIGPLSIKPRSIVDGITQPVQQLLSGLLSNKINELFPLKSQIAKVWNAAHKPVLVEKNYSAWLKLTPREVMLSPLYAGNNRVKVTVGINSYAELVVGPQPPALPPQAVPNLKLVSRFDRDFRVALNTDLFYSDIVKIAAPLLLNKEFVSDGRTITITNLELYGNGDKLVVKVETRGALDGVIYLTGRPRFDAVTNIFSVEELDFDLQSQSLLLQSADWFLHGTIKSKIQEKLTMDLTRRVTQTHEMARKSIARLQLVEHVFLQGKIKALKFSDLLVQKERISIQVFTEGEAAILFQ